MPRKAKIGIALPKMQLPARFPIESIGTAWQGHSKERRTDILIRANKGERRVWTDLYVAVLYNGFGEKMSALPFYLELSVIGY